MIIKGSTTASTTPRPDWEQTDPAKADYIKNKPQLIATDENNDGNIVLSFGVGGGESLPTWEGGSY